MPIDGKLPPNWKNFLRNTNKKTKLFAFFAGKIVMCPDNVVVVTKGDFSNRFISLVD